MASNIRRVDYFHITVKDQPGEAYKLLSLLAELGVNQLAFTAVPVGSGHTELTLFPEDPLKLINESEKARLELDGPYPAFLAQGDDEPGALVDIHVKLYEAKVDVYGSSGVTDGRGGFGYVLYIAPEDCDRAKAVLEG